MTENNQKQLGKTHWNIADQLRGAMNADDSRESMLTFLCLRYLSDNYEQAAKKELGRDYPEWLTQREMAGLFEATKQNIPLHLKNTFKNGELATPATVQGILASSDRGRPRGASSAHALG